MSTPLQLSVTTDVGAIGNMISECVKAGADVFAILNSVQEIASRVNAEVQAKKDQNAKDVEDALKSGNSQTVDKNLS